MTPTTRDLFTRFTAPSFDDSEAAGVDTAFQALYGRPENNSVSVFSEDFGVVEIDIQRGDKKIAAMIRRGTSFRPLDGQANTLEEQFSPISRVFPLIEEEGDIEANQLLFRNAGESPELQKSKLDRMRYLATRIVKKHYQRSLGRFEQLASQSILTGEQVAIAGTTNSDLIYDFYRNPANIATVSPLWDGTTPTIMADFDDACDLARDNGKLRPDIAIMGGDAMAAFIADIPVQTLADNRRFELVQVSTNPVPSNLMYLVDAGFEPRGRLHTPKGRMLWMFTYDATYETDASVVTNFMPENKIIVMSSRGRLDRYFGPADNLPMTPEKAAFMRSWFGFGPELGPLPANIKGSARILDPRMFYQDAYLAMGGKSITVRTQSAPIFATTHTDAIVVFTVTS